MPDSDVAKKFASFRPTMSGYQWRGLLACLLLTVGTLVLFPIAGQKWPRVSAFLPAYQTAIIFAYAVASYLVYGFYKENKAASLLYLWSGCLYTAAILVVQFLSFPGAFVPDVPLIGGKQTTIWLWCFWHFGPTWMLLLYAWSEWKRPGWVAADPERHFRRVALLTAAAIGATIALVTVFHDVLPILDVDGDFRRITTTGIAPLIQLLILAAMFMLWRATRYRNPLDVWLGVALLALLLDNSITMAGGNRLSVGWYVGRINALFSAVVMLAIYLKEINKGYLTSVEYTKKLASYQKDLEKQVVERTRTLEDTKAALLHSQKLEAVGKLTGGVAHDFNNVLQIINGSIDLIHHVAAGDDRITKRLIPARDAVERGTKLSSQLLAFARKQPLRPTTVNLCQIIQDMDVLLKRAVGERITVENIHCEGIWNTLADPHQVENMILNLVLNAADAIAGQGLIAIEITNVSMSRFDVSGKNEFSPGEYVKLAVRDNGCGMPSEVKEQAFEPFFTTKEVGKGTGLGLSMAYGFTKQSNGHIEIDSAPGQGTTVTVYLPRSVGVEKALPAAEPSEVIGGNECILVVEDDPAVMSALVGMLETLDYRVLTADCPDAAVEILAKAGAIDLLISDVVMPGKMSSMDLARYVKMKRPEIAVLFTSGYTRDAMVHHGRLDPEVMLLSKPYQYSVLAKTIRQALAQSSHNAQRSAA